MNMHEQFIELRTKNGSLMTSTISGDEQLIGYGQVGLAALSVRILMDKLAFSNAEPVIFSYDPHGHIEIIYYNCEASFPLSTVFDELIHHVSNSAINTTSLVTEVVFREKIRTCNTGSIRKIGESSSKPSELKNCLVITLTPLELLSKRVLREKYCAPDVIKSFHPSSITGVHVNSFAMELKHSTFPDVRGVSFAKQKDVSENFHKIARAFKNLCQLSSHPQKSKNLIYAGQSEGITTFTSESLALWEIDILDYRQLQKMANSLGVQFDIIFSTVTGSASLYLKSAPGEEGSEPTKKVTQANSGSGRKRKDAEDQKDDLREFLNDLLDERVRQSGAGSSSGKKMKMSN